MQARTYLRVLFNNIFHENIVSKILLAFVNFCNEFDVFDINKLKNNENVTLSISDTKKNIFFQSISGDKIDCQ